MTTVIFCGPTLDSEAIAAEVAAIVRPPARRGDILRAALERPDAILLIDGFFDRVQSTWHKEVLWALREGINVFGASSMGALRAAELSTFGMVGIGAIFEAYASGEYEDDDEVAIAHEDAASGYRPVSDAMVNIRATLKRARSEGVISEATRCALEREAKSQPFYARSLRAMLVGAPASPERNALRDWLPRGKVDQKREDALMAVREVARRAGAGWSPKRVDLELAETDGWRALFDEINADVTARLGHQVSDSIRDELCARGAHGRTVMAAMTRWLSTDRLSRSGRLLNGRAVEESINQFRRDRELLSAQKFDAWIDGSALSEPALEQFMRRDANFRVTFEEISAQLGPAVEDELTAWGELADVVASARQKRERLSRAGLEHATLETVGVTEGEVWEWFFRVRLKRDLPESIMAYAVREGTTLEQLERAALREYLDARLQVAAGLH